MPYEQETVDAAKKMYLRRYKVSDIARQLKIPRVTVYSWRARDCWDEMLEEEGPLQAAGRRLENLLASKCESDFDLKALDQATNVYERLKLLEVKCSQKALAGANGKNKAAKNKQLNDDGTQKASGKHNDFTGFTKDEIEQAFLTPLYEFQRQCWKEREHRTRMYLKSRQIGFTFYFSREGLSDALLNGRNKIFLSASRAQADIFRDYMQAFAMEAFGVELKGKDKIKVKSDFGTATIYLLSTNVATAQGPSGDCYIDEFFWIANFKKLNKVASAVATQKHWQKTYFSTPSVESHDAFTLWNMAIYNDQLKRENKPLVTLPKDLSRGKLCADGIYRRTITAEDAVKSGFDLIDIEQLQREYEREEFLQLFMCKFISDLASVFKLKSLEKCLADSKGWRDYKADAGRPYGNREVWLGYDPSRTVDGACIVVIAPPLTAGGKFRVLLRIRLQNQAWQYQASVIKELTEKFNVSYIGVDVTGPGSGVYEMVQTFFPAVTPILYNTTSKNQLVMKAQGVIDSERLAWDPVYSDISAGFMSIRRTTTKNNNVTYIADRNHKTGHADSAWAIMHALINEGMTGSAAPKSTYLL